MYYEDTTEKFASCGRAFVIPCVVLEFEGWALKLFATQTCVPQKAAQSVCRNVDNPDGANFGTFAPHDARVVRTKVQCVAGETSTPYIPVILV
jgi:hypothetical protein